MSIENPNRTQNSKEGYREIEISLVTSEDAGGITAVEYRAQRALHQRESVNTEGIPTAQDIEADYEQSLMPESVKRREEQWKELPDNPNQRYFVAKQNGKIIGYCIVDKYDNINQINGIYIDPDAQGQGLGKKFWQEALQFFDPEKDTVVMVLPYNSQAISYYQSLGFQETGKRAHGGGGHVMKSGAVMPVPIEMLRKADKPI